MQQESQAAPAFSPASFAGLLASLTTPEKSELQASKSGTDWNDDNLEEDVATISYERALRAHARYRPADPTDYSYSQSCIDEPAETQPALPVNAFRATAPADTDAQPKPARDYAAKLERNLKSATVTIRLSQTECEQLHNRASEAGLTVSAYLRSCTFEAESLRALVKDTLAQLNSVKSQRNQVAPAAAERSWLQWFWRLLPQWNWRERTQRA